MSASLLVVVGTDHHPFDRAVAWADAWAHGHPEDRVTIQYGTSTPPAAASGVDVVAPAELDRLMHEADVVITHGGPGTISAARAAGHLPLILPRNPAHGEHVDDHQMRFSAWADRHGLGRRCVELGELTATVEAALLGEGTRAAAPAEDDRVAGSIRRLSDLLAAPDRGRRLALDAPTVVYLGGFGRSGSTLLERLLATLEGTVALDLTSGISYRGTQTDDEGVAHELDLVMVNFEPCVEPPPGETGVCDNPTSGTDGADSLADDPAAGPSGAAEPLAPRFTG